jgi:hypothetical protein
MQLKKYKPCIFEDEKFIMRFFLRGGLFHKVGPDESACGSKHVSALIRPSTFVLPDGNWWVVIEY